MYHIDQQSPSVIRNLDLEQAMPHNGLPGINHLNTDLAECIREDRMVSLVLYDIDDFNRINREQGTKLGDRALAIASDLLGDMTDRAYRIGGDQFATLGTDQEAANGFRETLKRVSAHQLQVTVSASGGGVMVEPEFLRPSDETAGVLYGAASEMLTIAKQSGRDTVAWLSSQETCTDDTSLVAHQMYRDLARVNAYRARQMEVESRVDALTGLFNRRGFDEIFARLVDGSQRAGRPVGLLYMDSDSLKRINNEGGHEAGDRFIVDLASVLRSVVRRSDFIFRWGGDEFVVILESGEAGRAVALGERIREAVAERTVGTVSIGVYCGAPESADEAVRIADVALYAAKDQGKNRTVVGGGDRRRPPRTPE